MEIKQINTAPKDGSRVLVKFKMVRIDRNRKTVIDGEKWEECRWVSNKDSTGSEPHWEPWCGSERYITDHIKDENCLGWVELPDIWE